MAFVYTRAWILIEAWEDARMLRAPNNERFATPLLCDSIHIHEYISSTVTWAKSFYLLSFTTVMFTNFSRVYQNVRNSILKLNDSKIWKKNHN